MQQLKIEDLKPGEIAVFEFKVNEQGYFILGDGDRSTYSVKESDKYSYVFKDASLVDVKRPPRVPKVGDKFVWKGRDPVVIRTILFIDDQDVFYEIKTLGPSGRSRTHMSRPQFDKNGILQ